MSCSISVHIDQEKGIDTEYPKKYFEDWINEVEYELGSHSLKGISSVSIGLVSKNTIQDLNKTYRKKDKPTNVLAFASYPGLKESTNSLGDIAICPEVLKHEATEQFKEENSHLAHLFIHGILHLIGFDHEKIAEAKEMEKIEIRILKRLGIDDPYQIDLI